MINISYIRTINKVQKKFKENYFYILCQLPTKKIFCQGKILLKKLYFWHNRKA